MELEIHGRVNPATRILLLIIILASPSLFLLGDCSPAIQGCNSVESRLVPGLSRARPRVFSIADFGGVSDGITLNTKAFQKAIDHIGSFGKLGGATLYIPRGKWLTGCFNLTSHMTLFLEQDATILASEDPQDWPVVDPLPSYGRGRELPGKRYTSLLHGLRITDVAITGNNGTIDGQGLIWWNRFRSKTLQHTRGSLVEFMFSSNILVHNVTLINSPFWTLHPVYTSDVMIKGVTILAPHKAPNTDGVDPDSSSNVCIRDTYISNGDDAVAVKSGWDEYGLAFNRPSHDVFLVNLTVSGSHGISLGSEMSGGIYNVHAYGVSISGAVQGIHIKTSAGRGAYIRNASFASFEILDTGVAFSFTGIYGDHPDAGYNASAFATIENISFRDVVGMRVNRAGDFRGVPQSPFRHTCFTDVALELNGKSNHWNCSYIEGYSRHVSPPPCPELQLESECWS
ncbi:hypothetical protein SELMODRAFT_74934 [Selaginella moellendorffii]|uniref:Pectate lyase superfamily protein domain-containing protein n=1 Tax=Selaginella moellendorffii TaxID=88036 RepID=D8QQS1_SELML|nr:probable polygalacturonase [Selaginella moellendorffii]EFJ37851.1 hypothetical protein SELMODRAFT_74934 [Selaginella moellendorffii]|eukprot:XP_002960312.1 probable polygalacturonase [Selaginella moellendorffii]